MIIFPVVYGNVGSDRQIFPVLKLTLKPLRRAKLKKTLKMLVINCQNKCNEQIYHWSRNEMETQRQFSSIQLQYSFSLAISRLNLFIT